MLIINSKGEKWYEACVNARLLRGWRKSGDWRGRRPPRSLTFEICMNESNKLRVGIPTPSVVCRPNKYLVRIPVPTHARVQWNVNRCLGRVFKINVSGKYRRCCYINPYNTYNQFRFIDHVPTDFCVTFHLRIPSVILYSWLVQCTKIVF